MFVWDLMFERIIWIVLFVFKFNVCVYIYICIIFIFLYFLYCVVIVDGCDKVVMEGNLNILLFIIFFEKKFKKNFENFFLIIFGVGLFGIVDFNWLKKIYFMFLFVG